MTVLKKNILTLSNDNVKRGILMAFIALFVLSGTFIYLYHRNSVKSQEIAQYEQNWKAAMDTVEYYQLKNGDLLAERETFIASEAEARALLDMSNAELKDIKKQLGSALATITKLKGHVRVDSIYIESEPTYVTADSISIPFSFKDEWMALNGRTDYYSGKGHTNIFNISMDTPLTVGLAKNGKYFVTTPNPHLHITDITSVVSDKVVPKKQHWGIGVSVGPSVGYDFHHKDIYYGIGGSIGVIYKF